VLSSHAVFKGVGVGSQVGTFEAGDLPSAAPGGVGADIILEHLLVCRLQQL
jgi:hypothetical protein